MCRWGLGHLATERPILTNTLKSCCKRQGIDFLKCDFQRFRWVYDASTECLHPLIHPKMPHNIEFVIDCFLFHTKVSASVSFVLATHKKCYPRTPPLRHFAYSDFQSKSKVAVGDLVGEPSFVHTKKTVGINSNQRVDGLWRIRRGRNHHHAWG